MGKKIRQVLLLVFLTAGCSSGGGPSDSGIFEDGLDGFDGQDESSRPDLDIDDDFAIDVPSGTQACSLGHGGMDLDGILQERRHIGRVTFRPGLVRLPREADSVEVDLIETIELGPGKILATVDGAGTFTRTLTGTSDNGIYLYEFLQAFSADGDPFELSITAEFEVQNGVPTRPALILDTATMTISPFNRDSEDAITVKGRWQDGSGGTGVWTQSYTGCETTFMDAFDVRIEIEGGDNLELSYRCPEMSEFLINSTVCSCLLIRGVYTQGGLPHEVTDFFRLVFTSWNHCNFEQASLVVFDPPVTGTAALLIWGGAFSAPPYSIPDSVLVLDEGFQVTATLPITSFEHL
ncbi:MAG: hypothetical protein JRJ87_24700 [Deltaproteobacteria bacterium]|nr:hypothetical protein [Deltaproteobacteria bacterium]